MKTYEFNVYIKYGYGTINIDAENEDNAYDKLEEFIDIKMKETELTVDYEYELNNPDNEEEEEVE